MSDPQRPLRILHTASSQRWTGAAEPAAHVARLQLQHGHDVAFACIGGSSFERRLKAMEIPFVGGFLFDRRLNLRHFYEDIKRLRRYVIEQQPDILHCHLPHDNWLCALALRLPFTDRRLRRPLIIRTIHREAPPRRDLPHRWLMGKANDLILTVSQSMTRALIEKIGLPASRIQFVRGAVDLDRFRPDLPNHLIRDVFNVPHEAHVAGMLARMQPHRGHNFFIDTLDEVVNCVPMAFYIVAGRGELKYQLLDRIKNHPLAHHLRRVGYRKYDLPETYAAMDVVVLLRPGSDGTCRAMLEAMACGRPVIGARLGAIGDTIEHGVTGWLVDPHDRRALADTLAEALSDIDRLREMGRAARRHVETHHNFQTQYETILAAYTAALERHKK